jgi:pyruvate dehydrogenase E2 component (dihydrolipoamide acetyltransferase)
MKIEIRIPDIAENVETGLSAGILVAEGDQVNKDQSLVEVETDKATTEIPSTDQGKVVEIKVKEGDEIKVGDVIMILESGEGAETEKQTETEETSASEKAAESGEATESGEKKARTENGEGQASGEQAATAREPEGKDVGEKHEAHPPGVPGDGTIPASPAVRRKAREAGVDLRQVEGSGPGKRITAEDIRKYAGAGREQETALPVFSQWGNVSREPMDNIRKLTARRMHESWQQVPHVTQFDEADISGLEKYIDETRDAIEKAGGKLTITAILLKLSAFALQRFPRFNTSIDMGRNEIIYKDYINIGIAVDTERGLIVPVIRDVNQKSLGQLAAELSVIAQKAREKKISPDELQGGNFTISNLGGIGGTAFTPIVYSPQVAVLGISRKQYKPVYRSGDFEKRMVLPLSLSYDHRVIDGAEGARFLRWICRVLADPYALMQ